MSTMRAHVVSELLEELAMRVQPGRIVDGPIQADDSYRRLAAQVAEDVFYRTGGGAGPRSWDHDPSRTIPVFELPFGLPGRFWRGNLHTHSDQSDGALSPVQVAQIYRDAGYDFLAITDHFRAVYGYPVTDTRELRTPTFTTLIGAELHAPRTEFSSEWHIIAVGLPLDFPPTRAGETGPQLARRARAAGAFIGMAHPAASLLTLARRRKSRRRGVPGKQLHAGQDLTEGTLPLDMFHRSPYVRVTVIDSTGRRAWSNPIWPPIS